MNPTIVPFVKWVGGKRQLLKEIEKRLPKKIKNYYEPFIGGGALLFHLQPENAFISDLNSELINAYKTISSKNKLIRLREYLLLMEYGHHTTIIFDETKDMDKKVSPFYEKIKVIDRHEEFDGRRLSLKDSKEMLAARFIYLNKNNFNGLYRVNGSGHYNVPSRHLMSPEIFDWDNLLNMNDYLSNHVKIRRRGFEKILQEPEIGDFVYLDPPYDYEVGTNGFDSYQKNGFGLKGQLKLAQMCREFNRRGVNFMVSNHNTKLVRELFDGFNIEIVKVKRNVGGKGADRKIVEEVLVTNYEY